MRAALFVMLATAAACATGPVSHPKARVIVRTAAKAKGLPCPDKHIDVVEGPVPAAAVRLTTVTTEAAAPNVSLHAHEEAAKDRAVEWCADGVSVLQAVEAKGGVATTTMVYWRNRAEDEVEPANDANGELADAGVLLVDAGDTGAF